MLVLQTTRTALSCSRLDANSRCAPRVFGDSAHNTPVAAQTGPARVCLRLSKRFGCKRTTYSGDGGARSLVETVFYNGPQARRIRATRMWATTGSAASTATTVAIRSAKDRAIPTLSGDFFVRHAKSAVPQTTPVITVSGANPLRLTIGQPFVITGASATDPQDGPVPVIANCSSVDTLARALIRARIRRPTATDTRRRPRVP
jgi:hypothetical protein